ncbi:MAG: sulfatase-like hydrolase/transferase [Calditrichaeota bacterium]|nr:sulfatase-like hydrolase/transferase [Calditrichota bacterium]
MVVFDEFPVTSLMDEHHQIDPIRYPHFASLARDAYWFRNATAVANNTAYAVPAILTGNYVDLSHLPRLPIAAEHPNTLFTLLGSFYDLRVFEPVTQLCPERLCSKSPRDFIERMSSLILDLSVVYLHILLPMDFTSELPDVTRTWKDFAPREYNLVRRIETAGEIGPQQFEQFLESIRPAQSPSLYFLHVMLPHFPWIYLPSGKQYSLDNGTDIFFKSHRWVNDEALVRYGYQRHLLQVGFVDGLIGKLLDKLKRDGIYDRSLIVITADHGVSFLPGSPRRNPPETNYQDIMSVPLFIKAPYQHKGIISDRNVETIDILPTIADILNVPLPWQTHGHSALDFSFPERNKKVHFKKGSDKLLVFDPKLEAKYESLDRLLFLLGSGVKPEGPFKFGLKNDLIGKHINEIDMVGVSKIVVEFDQAEILNHVDFDAQFIPAQISGYLMLSGTTEASLDLAIAVNRTIRAIIKSYPIKRGVKKFSVVVPETSFQEGKNIVEAFVISMVGGQLCLERTLKQDVATYSRISSGNDGHETIITSNGASIPVIPGAIEGYVDKAVLKGGIVLFSGWAADIKNSQLPETIVIFSNGKFIYSGLTRIERMDVVKHFGNSIFQLAGYRFNLPLTLFKDLDNSDTRFFAISKNGIASELKYYNGYMWRKTTLKKAI